MKCKLEDVYSDYVSKTVLAIMLANDCRTARLTKGELQSVIDVLDSMQTLQDQIDYGIFEGFEDKRVRKLAPDNCSKCSHWVDCTHPARTKHRGEQ